MIIEDEGAEDIPDVSHDLPTDVHEVSHDLTPIFTQFLTRHQRIRSLAAHVTLRNDLVKHLWTRLGDLE